MIVDIAIDNIDNCISLIDPDVVDNLGREYFYGVYSENQDGECCGVMVWELRNQKNPDRSSSRIVYFNAVDTLAAEELLRAYDQAISARPVRMSDFEFREFNDRYQSVFRSDGFELREQEGSDVYLTLAELSALKFTKKKVPNYIVPISDLTLLEFKKGISNCIFSGNTGLLEDLTMLPPSWYDQDISCAVRTDDKITGLFLIHCTSGGIFIPQLLFASGVDSRKDLLHMLSYSIKSAADTYPLDATVLIRRHDDKSRALVSYLFPNVKGNMVTAGLRRETLGGNR